MKLHFKIFNGVGISAAMAFCIGFFLFANIRAQDNGNSGIRRDIAHDLNAVIPDNALNGDDVVEITINPNWEKQTTLSFELVNNP